MNYCCNHSNYFTLIDNNSNHFILIDINTHNFILIKDYLSSSIIFFYHPHLK